MVTNIQYFLYIHENVDSNYVPINFLKKIIDIQ